jgi:hypothetical protein
MVSGTNPETSNISKAQKFQNLDDNDSDDELGEESLLETPLDKIEPYQLFRDALLSKSAILYVEEKSLTLSELQQEQPQLYETLTTNLNPDEQTIVQGVVHQAEANAAAAAAALQAPGVAINGAP